VADDSAGVLNALDCAYGVRPERFPGWSCRGFRFESRACLSGNFSPELMECPASLSQLQVWLQARHRGVLALELEWTLDVRRLNGSSLPGHQQLTLRTAQPTQDVSHLRRLVGEHLSRATLAAPANHLRLRTLETWSLDGASKCCLGQREGERLHQLIERLSVRLLAQCRRPFARADRPERMQVWKSAAGPMKDQDCGKNSRPSNHACLVITPPALATAKPPAAGSSGRKLATTDLCGCSQVPCVRLRNDPPQGRPW
jgi:protein ImuB